MKGAWPCPEEAEEGREMEERPARPRMPPWPRGNEREHATGRRGEWRNAAAPRRCAAAARRRTEQAAIAMAVPLRQWRWGREHEPADDFNFNGTRMRSQLQRLR